MSPFGHRSKSATTRAQTWGGLGEYDEHLGYDCMTGGVRAGPVVLDGSEYGQRSCTPISAEALARMMADARLIAAAPEMCDALKEARAQIEYMHEKFTPTSSGIAVLARIDAVLAKAEDK